jgi:hypothetical protein
MSGTEYDIKVTEKGPKKVEVNIEIDKGKFPLSTHLTHFAFEDMGIEGVQMSMSEKNGQFVPLDVVEQARKLAANIMLEERFRE